MRVIEDMSVSYFYFVAVLAHCSVLYSAEAIFVFSSVFLPPGPYNAAYIIALTYCTFIFCDGDVIQNCPTRNAMLKSPLV